MQHQIGELLDQAGVLGNTHELRWWHDAAHRVRPAHERLGADHRGDVR